MAHISKRKMSDKVYRKVRGNMSRAIFSQKNGEDILASLLTKTEKVMLAKRLAVILLLTQDKSHYSIVKLLKISLSTPARLNAKLQSGEYKEIERLITKRRASVIKFIELILSARMPAVAGPSRVKMYQKLGSRLRKD